MGMSDYADRLKKVLHKAELAKAQHAKLSADRELAAAQGRKAAQEDWPKILERIETEDTPGGQSWKVVVQCRVEKFDLAAALCYYGAYQQTIKDFLPAGFRIAEESCSFPIFCFSIQWG